MLLEHLHTCLSRRTMLKTAASGFGYLAFAGLSTFAAEKENAVHPLAPKTPHFPARAKRVIFLCMEGGPAHVDTFDYKPKLTQDNGKAFGKGRSAQARLLGSPWKFQKHGNSGLWISELFPELARHADDLCLIRSMHTDQPAHPQAFVQMHTGMFQFPRPSMGSWALYGLGAQNENLPGFLTLCPPVNIGGSTNFGSCFLPAIYQGTPIGVNGRPIADATIRNLSNPRQSTVAQRAQLDLVQALNRSALERDQVDPGIEGVIESYELAFRMQGELPKVMDLGNETEATKTLYGIDDPASENFGRQCLLARRFVEAGVRFIEICHGGWDQHRNLKEDHAKNALAVDRPIAALLADLKQRDLLKDTLIIWGGEFGRTPYAQGTNGRDHNNKGFTIWMAGGGVKGGLSYGRTDDYGYEAVENKVHIHDWHATILHLLGLDHEKLTYRHAGRDMRLTDVKGTVVKGILG
jgi:Protein of unknown function (DUF1501)